MVHLNEETRVAVVDDARRLMASAMALERCCPH